MEAAIGSNHQNGGSGPSIFDFDFSTCRAGVQRELPLAMTLEADFKGRFLHTSVIAEVFQ
jgi:hypothetical protein